MCFPKEKPNGVQGIPCMVGVVLSEQCEKAIFYDSILYLKNSMARFIIRKLITYFFTSSVAHSSQYFVEYLLQLNNDE